MTRPLLLDLFCGGGGAAEGYHRAGFDVIGVDLADQPNYPFRFIQDDALKSLRSLMARGWKFDAIHASPPCHDHSRLRRTVKIDYGTAHLLSDTLSTLKRTGLPFVVENVDSRSVRTEMAAATGNFFVLCGSMFGLELTKQDCLFQLRRHRLFATSIPMLVPGCQHRGRALDVSGHNPQGRIYREHKALGLPMYGLAERRQIMGIDWTDREELSEAIPPAFTQYIGEQLLEQLEVAA